MVAHFVSVVVIVKQLASGGFRGLRTRSDDVITLRRRRRHAWECRATGSCRRLHACAIDQLPATAAAGPSNEATQRNPGCQLWGQEVKGQRSEIRSGVMQMKRRNEDGMRARRLPTRWPACERKFVPLGCLFFGHLLPLRIKQCIVN